MNFLKLKTIVLVILDGWGIAQANPGNAISNSNLPCYNRLLSQFPHTKLLASGEAVGLADNDPGNTEIGHLNIGAGRIIEAPVSEINKAINNGIFYQNQAFKAALNHLQKFDGNLHLMGLFGSGHVHASNEHLLALLNLAKLNGLKKVYLHLFTDGRDSPPTASLSLIYNFQKQLKEQNLGIIASISGRFYAMDRDRRLERTRKVYEALIFDRGERNSSTTTAIENFYKAGITDEFIPPTIIADSKGNPLGLIKKNDVVIFYNHRGERAIQLTELFLKEARDLNLFFLTMTEFDKHLPVSAIAFPPKSVKKTLGEVLSLNNLKQLRIAESEKERFVTYYFNGFREESFPDEERIIIPSPQIPTYDLKPEMSAFTLTDVLLEKLGTGDYNFVLVNFANPDIVGHTGLFKPTVKACEAVDSNLNRIVDRVLKTDNLLIVTADHGNAEEKIDLATGLILTEHTNNPVPIILVAKNFEGKTLQEGGILADIAPTILNLMAIEVPEEMTGKDLLL